MSGLKVCSAKFSLRFLVFFFYDGIARQKFHENWNELHYRWCIEREPNGINKVGSIDHS